MSEPFSGMAGRPLPGFVDIQVNGGFGHDFTADPSSIWAVAARLPECGVTAFLPTLTSGPPDTAVRALEVLASGPPAGWRGATPIGLHVEGPMLSHHRRGTHPPEALRSPSLEYVETVLAAGAPRMVTLAPELDGAEPVVRRLVDAGCVVAIGHSDATAAEANRAFEWGISHATHLFNGMSGLGHRDPGVAAAVLDHDSVTAGLIADGVHLSPESMRLAFRLLGSERLALVTDSISAMGAGDGVHRIGSIAVEVTGVEVRNAEGRLAGSAATFDHVARTMREATGCSWEELAAMTSATPARIAGHRRHPADLVLVDDDLRVLATSVGGEIVYRGVA